MRPVQKPLAAATDEFALLHQKFQEELERVSMLRQPYTNETEEEWQERFPLICAGVEKYAGEPGFEEELRWYME